MSEKMVSELEGQLRTMDEALNKHKENLSKIETELKALKSARKNLLANISTINGAVQAFQLSLKMAKEPEILNAEIV